MYYNVAQLLKEPTGSSRTYRINEPVAFDDGPTHISPQGQLSLVRIDKGIWVNARLEVGVALACSRCLKTFHHPLTITIEELYVPITDIDTGEPLGSADGDEEVFTIDQQNMLDLREALRQYTLANQPMKPLCWEDCPGLCPICGTNMGENPCSCQEGTVDPLWGPLLKLVGEDNR